MTEKEQADITETEAETITEAEAHINPFLGVAVEPDSELKGYLVERAGKKFENEEVTVQMIAEMLASEFPEFTWAFAEENFLRGYQLGLDDAYKTFTGKTEEAVGSAD
tara:strand:- start:139 stop:462 length:324 start_codon:yes stop_codon:yes gene_type:complete